MICSSPKKKFPSGKAKKQSKSISNQVKDKLVCEMRANKISLNEAVLRGLPRATAYREKKRIVSVVEKRAVIASAVQKAVKRLLSEPLRRKPTRKRSIKKHVSAAQIRQQVVLIVANSGIPEIDVPCVRHIRTFANQIVPAKSRRSVLNLRTRESS